MKSIKYIWFILICAISILTSCISNTQESTSKTNTSILEIEISSDTIRSIIKEFAAVRNTEVLLLKTEYSTDSTVIYLQDLYSSCLLNTGDQYGFLVDSSWQNITAPMFKAKIESLVVYIESGVEQISKSKERYSQLLNELNGKIDLCVRSYDPEEDSFEITAPRTSQLVDWMIVVKNNGTYINTYRSKREGFDDFYWDKRTIRIDSNYNERYN